MDRFSTEMVADHRCVSVMSILSNLPEMITMRVYL
jgi:hypothetical protein